MHWRVKYFRAGESGRVPMREEVVCTPRKVDAVQLVDADMAQPRFITRTSRDTTPNQPCLCGKRTT